MSKLVLHIDQVARLRVGEILAYRQDLPFSDEGSRLLIALYLMTATQENGMELQIELCGASHAVRVITEDSTYTCVPPPFAQLIEILGILNNYSRLSIESNDSVYRRDLLVDLRFLNVSASFICHLAYYRDVDRVVASFSLPGKQVDPQFRIACTDLLSA